METKPPWISSTRARATIQDNTWTTTVTVSHATTHATVAQQQETKTVTAAKQMPNSTAEDVFATTGITLTTMATACFVIPHVPPVQTVPPLAVSVASTELLYKPMEHVIVPQEPTLILTEYAKAALSPALLVITTRPTVASRASQMLPDKLMEHANAIVAIS